jgi:pyruvate kinase
MLGTHAAGTKIVATLGPATASPEVIERLLRAGVDVVRLNFSHGRRADHAEALRAVRALSARLDLPVAVMGDLCGPKIRLGEISGGAVDIAAGDRLRILRQPMLGDAQRVSANRAEMFDGVQIGHRVLIDDGAVRLRVSAKDADGLVCTCEVGGKLSDHKGLNLPDTDLQIAALTDQDLQDVAWAVEAGLEYLALSFVRRAEDVEQLRQRLAGLQADCEIISKIETRHALDNLEAIIEASDVVLVARGDLGVEVDIATVPRWQKDITARCRRAGKPAIIATQMLQSMVHSPTPTRAEVNDVANAIYDGADAVLLSAETAVGEYPVQAVEMLERVALETEAYDQDRLSPLARGGGTLEVASAVAASICAVADDIRAKAVVVWTETGTLARLVSKHRLDRPVVALTASPTVRRRASLYYGVRPFQTLPPKEANELLVQADRVAIAGGWAAAGDLIVVGFGPHSLAGGETGAIVIHTVEAR